MSAAQAAQSWDAESPLTIRWSMWPMSLSPPSHSRPFSHYQETEAVEADTDNTEQAENVSAVNIWPPPAPPRLVIPTLAGSHHVPVNISC